MAKYDGFEVLENVNDGRIEHGVKRPNVPRSRVCMILAYPDSSDFDAVAAWLRSTSGLRGYWGKVHANEQDGIELDEKPHLQIVLYLNDEKDAQEWARWLVRKQCPCLKPMNPGGKDTFALWRDVVAAVRYLLHLDEQNKPHYPALDMEYSCNNPEKWLKPSRYTMGISQKLVSEAAAEIEQKSALSVLQFIEENGIINMSNLCRALADDPVLFRFVLSHRPLCNDFIRDNRYSLTSPALDTDIERCNMAALKELCRSAIAGAVLEKGKRQLADRDLDLLRQKYLELLYRFLPGATSADPDYCLYVPVDVIVKNYANVPLLGQ